MSTVITSLTARANAVKMLHARIKLLKTYLQNLPPSYLTTPSSPDTSSTPPPDTDHTEINHPLLRSIQALLNRLPLLTPASPESFEAETLAQKADVSLVSLLGKLSNNVSDARELGKKFAILEHAKQISRQLPKHNMGSAGQFGFSGNFSDHAPGNSMHEGHGEKDFDALFAASGGMT